MGRDGGVLFFRDQKWEISCNAVSFHTLWNFTWGTLIAIDGNNGNNSPRCYGFIALRPKQETNNTTNTYFSIE